MGQAYYKMKATIEEGAPLGTYWSGAGETPEVAAYELLASMARSQYAAAPRLAGPRMEWCRLLATDGSARTIKVTFSVDWGAEMSASERPGDETVSNAFHDALTDTLVSLIPQWDELRFAADE